MGFTELREQWSKLASVVNITERPASAVERLTGMQQGFDASASKVWEATINGDVAGQLWWSPGTSEYGSMGLTIHAVFVDPRHRRQGVATALLDHMLAKYAGQPVDPGGMTPEGQQLWNAWVNPKGFYEVNGTWWLEEESDLDE